VIFCKYVISKVLSLVSVSARSSLGLVSTFFYQNLGLGTSMSRLGLEDFGRDSSSGLQSAKITINKLKPFLRKTETTSIIYFLYSICIFIIV